MTLPGDFCLPENLVWVIMGLSKTTVAVHRRVQRIVDSFITGQGESICNMLLFLCVVTLLTPRNRW